MREIETRHYKKEDVAWFFTTKDQFGALSNMARGYPLKVFDLTIPSSEALYQALKFPHLPDFQKAILSEEIPKSAKMLAVSRSAEQSKDWFDINVLVMDYVLHLKTAQHLEKVISLAQKINGRPIVEISRRDDFWGTFETPEGLVGKNVLGRLWMRIERRVHDLEASHGFEMKKRVELPKLLGMDLPDLSLIRESGFQSRMEF